MQAVSTLWQQLLSAPGHRFERSMVIGDEEGLLVSSAGDVLLFADNAIIVADDSPGSGWRDARIVSLIVSNSLFGSDTLEVGNAISGEMDAKVLNPAASITNGTAIRLYIRVTDGIQASEWLPYGVFFVDEQEITHNSDGLNVLTIHGYDRMMFAEQDYPSSTIEYPAYASAIVQEIASAIRVGIDSRTWAQMTPSYRFPLPVGYSCREVLEMIAAAYAGNWTITENGLLRLIGINELPAETNYLIDTIGEPITFGGDRILV